MTRKQHITELTILNVQLIVEHSKRIPGFESIFKEDQITLLKTCFSEVMMLRAARRYDTETDSIYFAHNKPYTRETFHRASMGEFGDTTFRFCRTMCCMEVDNVEYALLTAIVTFCDTPKLLARKKVERFREFYIEILRSYTTINRPADENYFATLLSILDELRTLGDMNSKHYSFLKVYYKKLPPCLEEIWQTAMLHT
ncbi:unnamed protein product [Larinioides sclopetarius]